MGICHDHGTSTFAHNGYFLFCISARVGKVCFTTHSPATLEAQLIWFSDYIIYIWYILYVGPLFISHFHGSSQTSSGSRWVVTRSKAAVAVTAHVAVTTAQRRNMALAKRSQMSGGDQMAMKICY